MSDGAVIVQDPTTQVVVQQQPSNSVNPQSPGIQGPPGPSGTVTGMIFLWPATVIPPGWMLCDGSAISRVAYATLFATIGVAWGAGDGSTTFNLPDLRGRVAVGASPGSLTGRPTARTIASNGGEESHTLTVPELPSHGHSYQATTTGSYTNISSSASGTSVVGSLYASAQPTGNTGGGGAHNNMQPFAVLNYLIKT